MLQKAVFVIIISDILYQSSKPLQIMFNSLAIFLILIATHFIQVTIFSLLIGWINLKLIQKTL